MKLSSFTFIVSEDCNFRCSYCYQKKTRKYIDSPIIDKALDFFSPFFREHCYINFTGGEPLLAFEQIKHAVRYFFTKKEEQNQSIHFALTTNGSLISEDILQFLNKYKFTLMLSFDGTAQDISRQKGSFKHIASIIEKLLKCPHIDLEINSVFSPKTVTYLSESIQFIVELGVPKVNFTLSKNFKWDSSALFHFKKEMALLREFLLTSYKGTETIPLTGFRNGSAKGVFTCVAGSDRMAITPDGKLWGCHVFPNFFLGKEELKEYQKYCFGDLDTFIKNYKAKYFDIIGNYLFLRMDYFYTPDESCLDCASLESCRECPIIAAYSSKKIGKIPITACKINKIIRGEKRLFWKELESYNRDRMYSH